MKYTTEFDRQNGICTVHVSGQFRRPGDSDFLKGVAIDMLNGSGCGCFLVDLTGAEVIGGTMDAYNAASPHGEIAGKLRKVRTAFVCRQLSEEDHFYETVAVNRGFPLRAFDSLEEAVAWLKQDP